MLRRRVVLMCVAVGAVLGAFLPLLVGGASVAFFTDIEARVGYGLLSGFVHALLGAAAGWMVSQFALYVVSRRQ